MSAILSYESWDNAWEVRGAIEDSLENELRLLEWLKYMARIHADDATAKFRVRRTDMQTAIADTIYEIP